MKPQPRVGQRRAHLRFEVMGTMSASLLSTETLKVLNVGVSGALVESAMPLPLNGEFRMQVVLEGHVTEATVKIRRVAAVRSEGGLLRYHIGLEFLAIAPDAEEIIKQIVVDGQAQV